LNSRLVNGVCTSTATPTAAPTGAPTSAPTPPPTTSGTPTGTPTASPTAAVTGDPHVTNVDGDRFNIVRAGVHELLRLPRRAQSIDYDGDPLLDVTAGIEWNNGDCNDPYVKEVGLSGWWLRSAGSLRFRTRGAAPGSDGAAAVEINGSRVGLEELGRDQRVAGFLDASVPGSRHIGPQHKIQRARFLTVQLRLPAGITLKVDWVNRIVPGSTMNHLNFAATDLRKFAEATRMDIGGLLGRDGHAWAASAPEVCHPKQDLRIPLLSAAGSQQISAAL